MTGLLSPMRYAQVVYLTAPAARPVVTRAVAGAAPWGPAPGGDPGAARRRVHPGAAAMSVWSWLKLTVCLWLLRKMIKVGGWLLLAAARHRGVAGDAGRGDRVWRGVAAGLAAGAAAPDRGLGAAPGRDLARHPGGAAGCLAAGRADPGAGVAARLVPPGRPGDRPGVRAAGPVRGPGRARAGRAGVGVADLRHHHRAGRHHGHRADHLRRPPVETAGPHRPGPDRRARRGAAAGAGAGGSRSAAPSASIGHRWHPVFTIPAAACTRHMVIVGATGSAGRRT